MIDYTASMIARLEHEQRIQSLAPVYDYDLPAATREPGRLSRLLGQCLYAMGRSVASLGERIGHEQAGSHETPLMGRGDVPG
jgi:hypothetical protein